jgi:glycerol-3-phosphate dehydrogenase
MPKYVAAIDQGTTSTRCILFDHAGNIVATDQKEHRQIYPKPGWVEHDALEIWENTQRVVRAALDKSGTDVADIAAIGITNQREVKDAFALKTDPHYTHSEIAVMAQRKKIVHLDDLVLRRTLLAYLGQLTRPLLVELSIALGDSLGWDGAQKKAEVMRTLETLADRHGVQL